MRLSRTVSGVSQLDEYETRNRSQAKAYGVVADYHGCTSAEIMVVVMDGASESRPLLPAAMVVMMMGVHW